MGFFFLFFLSGQPCYLSKLFRRDWTKKIEVEIHATCLAWEAHIRCKRCCLPTCSQVGRRRADSFTQSGFITDHFIYETSSSFIHNFQVSVKQGCADECVHTLPFLLMYVCWNTRSGLHGRTLWTCWLYIYRRSEVRLSESIKKIFLLKFLFNPKVKSQSVVTSSPL